LGLGIRNTHGSWWRTLEERAEDPAFQERLYNEFPTEIEAITDPVERRTFLRLMGASLALAGVTACTRQPPEKIVPYVRQPEEIVPGIPRHYATTMPFGRSAYGLVVESHEGRPTKIEGNELHPATAGRSSVRIQAAILGLYDPDRVQHVRHGDKDATWAELVEAWTELEKTHLADGGAKLALLTPSFSSPTKARLLDAFRARFPQALVAVHEPVSDENILAATPSAHPVLHLDKDFELIAHVTDQPHERLRI